MTLLQKVKRNLIIDFDTDDEDRSRCISAARASAEAYQHVGDGYYDDADNLPPRTEQAVIMLASHYYESRDGSTGGFFSDSVPASENVQRTVDTILRLDRDWRV